MTARRLVLLRHGETDWNAVGRYQGQIDVALNALGREQAATAAVRLVTLGPTQVVTSDLSRAVQTAAALAEVTGLTPVVDARLREINVGEWGGLTHAQMHEIDPEFLRAMQEGRDYRRSTSGETATETGLRVAAAIDDIGRSASDEDVVVIVSHGLALRHAIGELLGMRYAQTMRFGALSNCGWALLTPHRYTSGWQLQGYNVTAQPAMTDQPARGEAAE